MLYHVGFDGLEDLLNPVLGVFRRKFKLQMQFCRAFLAGL